MNFRKLLLAGAATTAASATFITPTQAAIIDRPHFKVEPIIIVWAVADVDDSTDPLVTDFIVGSGGGTDLIADDGRAVLTGSLVSGALESTEDALGTLDAEIALGGNVIDLETPSSLTAFNPMTASITSGSQNLAWDSSFYVASNTPFSIEALISGASVTTVGSDFSLDDIGYSLAVTETASTGFTHGNAAQSIGGSFPTINNLGDLEDTSTVVYDGLSGGTRTAASSGTIRSQSVRFDATYTFLDGNYDLSEGSGEIQADVVYTFFTP